MRHSPANAGSASLKSMPPSPAPPEADHRTALEQYRRRAGIYDLELAAFEPIRRRAVALLALRHGDVVIDVGCGTGLSLPLLLAAIGAEGRVIGIEQSPEMMAKARARVRTNGWSNVTLLQASAADAHIGLVADAALLHFTHDILREERAVANVLRHLRPGAHITAAGLKWAGLAGWPLNLFVFGAALHSVSSLEGLTRPWEHLEARTEHPRLDTALGGCVYLFSAEAARQGTGLSHAGCVGRPGAA
jgi:SAM-dependent methyltransferase